MTVVSRTFPTLAALEAEGAEIIHHAVREPEGWRVTYTKRYVHHCSARTYADGSRVCVRCGTIDADECRAGADIIREMRRGLV